MVNSCRIFRSIWLIFRFLKYVPADDGDGDDDDDDDDDDEDEDDDKVDEDHADKDDSDDEDEDAHRADVEEEDEDEEEEDDDDDTTCILPLDKRGGIRMGLRVVISFDLAFDLDISDCTEFMRTRSSSSELSSTSELSGVNSITGCSTESVFVMIACDKSCVRFMSRRTGFSFAERLACVENLRFLRLCGSEQDHDDDDDDDDDDVDDDVDDIDVAEADAVTFLQ